MKKALIVLSLLLVGSGIAQYLSLTTSTASEQEPAVKVAKVDKKEPQKQSYPDAKAPESTRYLFCNYLPVPKVLLTPYFRPELYIPYFTKREGGKKNTITFCVQDATGKEYMATLNYYKITFRVTEDPKAVMSQIIPNFGGEAQTGVRNWLTEEDAVEGHTDPLKGAVVVFAKRDLDIFESNK